MLTNGVSDALDAANGIHYLDHSATSWPKPPEVAEAVRRFLLEQGGNPGRGGHRLALRSARAVHGVRERIAERFGVPDSAGVIFTRNATEALNMAIKGLVRAGEHVVATVMEHNSVLRPLERLRRERGVRVTLVEADAEGRVSPEAVRGALSPGTRLLVVTHASNVTGTVNDVAAIAEVAHRAGVLLLVDAAQTAGILELDLSAQRIDLLAASAHKALEGPPGVGVLLLREDWGVAPLIEGGTGSRSERPEQPEFLPDRLEAGTANTLGIIGLGAALEVLTPEVVRESRRRTGELGAAFLAGLRELRGWRLSGVASGEGRLPVFSLDFPGRDNAEIAQELDDRFGVLTRAGLHCAPLAHRAMGTFPQGTVRFSLGRSSTLEDVRAALEGLRELLGR
jgi:cysteine desulfurase family protein